MSAPQLDILHSLLKNLERETAKEIPQIPGQQATPNTLQRLLYRSKGTYDKINTLLEELREIQTKINETIAKTTAGAPREGKERAYLEFCLNSQLEQKVNLASNKKQDWERQTQSLEDRLDIAPSTTGSTTTTQQQMGRRVRPQVPPIQLKGFPEKPKTGLNFGKFSAL